MGWRVGLKAKFISLILVLLSLVFGSIAIVLLRTNTASLRDNLYVRATSFAALATDPIGNAYLKYSDSGTVLITQQVNTFVRLDENITNVTIVDTQGKVQYSLQDTPVTISAELAESFEPKNFYGSNNVIRRIVYPFIERDGKHRYAMVYDFTDESVRVAQMSLTRSILTYSLLGLLVTSVVTYLAINQFFLKPIKRLRDQAMVISAGNYGAHIPHSRTDEIGDLARSVSQMAESLKADITKLKEIDSLKTEFLMIASHNLLTPLTIVEGYVSMARNLATTDELKEVITNIEVGSKRLSTFAEDMLVIATIEAGKSIFSLQPTPVDRILNGIAKDFPVLTRDKHIIFESHIEYTGVTIQGSEPYLRDAIWNMLENALKFTPKNGTIALSARKEADDVVITISDSGIGISPEEIPKLFTKFHRGTSTLTYDYEGTGVGLYISKLIINEHKGTIAVESKPGKGTTFTITLPTESV